MFCPKCGNPINNNAHFCPNCGTSMYGAQPASQSTSSQGSNAYATVGLVFAIFIAIIGFIFSIIGLIKSKEMNGKGHGVALAGLIISILEIVIGMTSVLCVLMFT